MIIKKSTPARDVNEYIGRFPKSTQVLLKQLRSTIIASAPEAEEGISYQMPAYKLHGVLVYFGGYDHHIGFYPTGAGIEAFKKDLTEYNGSKGTVQFPLDKPLPLKLIAKIVAFRKKENLQKASIKTKPGKKP